MDYRARAEEARRMAETAPTPLLQDRWRKIAEAWESMDKGGEDGRKPRLR